MQSPLSPWLNALKKFKAIALLVFVFALATTAIVVLYYPRKYHSQAKLILRVGRETVSLDPTSTVGDTLYLQSTREHEIQTALGVMESNTLFEKIIDEVGRDVVLTGRLPAAEESSGGGLAFIGDFVSSLTGSISRIDPIPEQELAVRELREGIRISAPDQSSVVTIDFRAKTPEAAQAVMASWLKNYVSLHVSVNRTHGTYEFFLQEGKTLREKLAATRERIREFKSEAKLLTVEGQQKLLEQELSVVRTSLLQTESELAATESRIEKYGDILTSVVAPSITEEVTGKANESRDLMRTQLFALETLEKDLQSKLKSDHPKLTAVQRQLAELRPIVSEQSEARQEVTTMVNPAYQRMLEEQLLQIASQEALQDKREKLASRQQMLLAEIDRLNADEREIQELKAELAILELRYAEHAKKQEHARMDEVLESQEITSINVVQPASLEFKPVTPNKPLCAILGLAAAVFGAVSIPMLLDVQSEMRRSRELGSEAQPMPSVAASGESPSRPGSSTTATVMPPTGIGPDPSLSATSKPR